MGIRVIIYCNACHGTLAVTEGINRLPPHVLRNRLVEEAGVYKPSPSSPFDYCSDCAAKLYPNRRGPRRKGR